MPDPSMNTACIQSSDHWSLKQRASLAAGGQWPPLCIRVDRSFNALSGDDSRRLELKLAAGQPLVDLSQHAGLVGLVLRDERHAEPHIRPRIVPRHGADQL